jgi:hypothetical protein
MNSSTRYAALLVLLLAMFSRVGETETQYLSGLGKDDPVTWQIRCDNGQNARLRRLQRGERTAPTQSMALRNTLASGSNFHCGVMTSLSK